ncbi:MAG TPA: DUF1622 domain-containing protein [Phenylobacterium sp.]|uniref:DUF1622 domain-containing protein n=1 Tax=Phenylobacterium sp. TaxID=1871053 RepID=UPI002B475AB6|nr:DUF1622 domain-containing protein [Phenylobacterium sp.]HKR88280.1 DUF1622 domain-containing protein [Phenylobacterium sp.]
MELILKEFAANVALAAELVCVVCIAIGAITAIVKAAAALAARRLDARTVRRGVWMSFAVWIILALEFALGADIVRTAIAPTWNEIGQLAAIAVIRTGLNYFLERDLEDFAPEAMRPRKAESGKA